MVMAMLDIDERKQTVLVIVIEKDNLDRMAKADPITLESVKKGGMLPVPKYPSDFSILIAYEEDDAELYRMAKDGRNLLYWLERGRKWKPDVDGRSKGFVMPKEGTGKSRTGEQE
jgi:hypothetical protein